MEWLIPLSEAHLRSILKPWMDRYEHGEPRMAPDPGVPEMDVVLGATRDKSLGRDSSQWHASRQPPMAEAKSVDLIATIVAAVDRVLRMIPLRSNTPSRALPIAPHNLLKDATTPPLYLAIGSACSLSSASSKRRTFAFSDLPERLPAPSDMTAIRLLTACFRPARSAWRLDYCCNTATNLIKAIQRCALRRRAFNVTFIVAQTPGPIVRRCLAPIRASSIRRGRVPKGRRR